MKRFILLMIKLMILWFFAWPILLMLLTEIISGSNSAGQATPGAGTTFVSLIALVTTTVFLVRRTFPKKKQAEIVELSGASDPTAARASAPTFVEKIFGLCRRTREEHIRAEQARRLSEMQADERFALDTLIREHNRALVRNWYRLVETDDYGTRNYGKWKEEVARFFDSRQHAPIFLSFEQSYTIVTNAVESALNEQDLVTSRLRDNPYEFERRCAEDLLRAGWNARLTSTTGDQGVDIIAEKNHVIVVIQCKLYSGPVGNKAVQEAISGKEYEKADYAAVVAPNGFTRSAQDLAQRANVLLLGDRDIRLLEHLIK